MELLEIYLNNHFNKLKTLLKSSDNTFYIYTTGIGNWNTYEVINIWEKCRFKHIMDLIPKKFKNIVIKHYDPILNADTNEKYELNETKTTVDKINTVLTRQDLETSNKEIKTEQTFTQDYFDYKIIDTKKPYIILDFANIFKYNYNYTTKEYYISFLENQDKIKNLNCVYIPFPDSNDCNNIKQSLKYFEYNSEDNTIKTYIELFFKILTPENYDYNKNNEVKFTHYAFIGDILNNHLYKKINDHITTKYNTGSSNRGKLMDYIEENYKDQIFREFYEKLFEENISSEQLFNINNYQIVFLIKNIIDNWPMI